MAVKYARFNVSVKFLDQIQGGVPKSKEVVKAWADVKGLTEDQRKEVESAAVDPNETMEKVTTGFLQDDIGLYVKDITWKAHIKDMLSRMSVFMKSRGSKNEVHFGMFIRPENVRFTKGGVVVSKEDGTAESVAHISGPAGRMSALKMTQYISQPECSFSIFLLQPVSKISKDDLLNAFIAGQEYGYGANRSMGQGRYELTKFEEAGEIQVDIGKSLNSIV